MAKSETLPVQKDAEKLCKHTLIITNNLDNFPTKYRFTLVDRVLRISFDIHDYICDANNTFDMSERVDLIQRSISSCRKMKMYTRMVLEVLHPKCSVSYWDKLIDNIEKQLRNWKEYTKKLL